MTDVVAQDTQSFRSALLSDASTLLQFRLKVWLKCDDYCSTKPEIIRCAFAHLCTSLRVSLCGIFGEDDSKVAAHDAHATALRAVKGVGEDADRLAARIVNYLKYVQVGRVEKDNYELVVLALEVVRHFLAVGIAELKTSALVLAFVKRDLATLVCQCLRFVSTDPARKHPKLSQSDQTAAVENCVLILSRIFFLPVGSHWATVMFNHGYLRRLSDFASFPHLMDGAKCQGKLLGLMKMFIPQSLVHRPVVIAAIRAAKRFPRMIGRSSESNRAV